MKITVEAKFRKRNPQWYLLDNAVRFYEDKDSEYIRERMSKLLARLLAADGVLRRRGEPVLSPGQREALLVVYEAFTPTSVVEQRNGKAQN